MANCPSASYSRSSLISDSLAYSSSSTTSILNIRPSPLFLRPDLLSAFDRPGRKPLDNILLTKTVNKQHRQHSQKIRGKRHRIIKRIFCLKIILEKRQCPDSLRSVQDQQRKHEIIPYPQRIHDQ